MAIEAGNVIWNIGADLKPLNQALGDSEKAVTSSMGNILAKGQQIGAAMSVMGAGIIGSLGAAITSTTQLGNQIYDVANRTGFSTEAVSKWGFALQQSGGDITMLQVAIRGMSNLIDSARQGMNGSIETLGRLGLTVESFKGLSPESLKKVLTKMKYEEQEIAYWKEV